MKSNRSKFAVLGLLARGPASGYDLKKTIETELTHFWNESYGQIYPILKALADERLAVRRVERQSGRPDRQIYTITPKGRQDLEQWLAEPATFQVNRNETLLKLFLNSQIDVASARELVARYREHHARILTECNVLEKSIEKRGRAGGDAAFQRMTINHCRQQARSAIRWCDQTLRELESRGRKRPSARRKRARAN